ncbi:hypothetical protein CH373_11415 [Leptospira perolatii]|uniref:Tll0287-like domain-containing protein n=1 Tax=Leptospira perolatii TaxID=2023191 RepID=A0A2M9ZMD5_9LEPT|nr:hypothetical protein CH360_12850 [Leptospira perolatii]PJZ73174.1 hypothetical protein CH373_11415 [Leptospira perolatii]
MDSDSKEPSEASTGSYKLSFFQKIILRGITIILLVQFFAVCDDESRQEKKEIILDLFDQLQSELLSELQDSIRKNGPAASINICKTLSPKKEKELSAKYPGLSIRRISDKNRNPSHAPNEWEAKTLEEWKSWIRTGKPPFTVFESNSSEMRAMKPIIIASETCLKCHGPKDKMDANVRRELEKNYPNDKAFGYSVGELRGAFSATWKRF